VTNLSKRASVATALLLLGTAAFSQTSSDTAPIPAPVDRAYPGTITLHVDATDLERRIFRVRQSIPVDEPGHMTLLFPRWIPGYHSPTGPIHNYAGLIVSSGGLPLKWTRDTFDVYAIHVDVPQGVTHIDIAAQALTPTENAQGSVVMSSDMLRLNWYTLALYPAGYFTRRIDIDASVKLPTGWSFGTALDLAAPASDDSTLRFKTVSFETLMDSTLIAGRHLKRVELDTADKKRTSRVALTAIADEAEQLDIRPHHIRAMSSLVEQSDKLFGFRPFDRYEFLLWLSERIGGAGIEHQRSSENGVSPKYFAGWDSMLISRNLLAHEYTHAWNGKYRRPADLWTPNFNVPMRDSMLWIYEGQTEYWGIVLATRAGFTTVQQTLDEWASIAAVYETQAGRTWRPLQDTTNDPIIASRRPIPWRSWQRSEDYYREGALLWLDVDTLLREMSNNKQSLDTFARAFFAIGSANSMPSTYTFDDVIKALNAIQPYAWQAFFNQRLNESGNGAPLDGIVRGGYRLQFVEQPSEYLRANDTRRGVTDLSYSVGLTVNSRGRITNVVWDGPAFKAGLTSGMELIAVNNIAFERDRLLAAVKATKDGAALDLLMKEDNAYRTVRIDYRAGLRYPVLASAGSSPMLDKILAPRK